MKMVGYILGGLVAAAIIFVTVSGASFNRMVSREVEGMIADVGVNKPVKTFSYTDLEGLPAPVQNYFRNVLPEGVEYARFVRLKQEGQMKTAEGSKWAPLEAEQYFAVEKPGFIWQASVKPVPVLWVKVRDKYLYGEGEMFVKLISSYTLFRETGEEMNKASLLRYLAEALWFPTALLPTNENIAWEPVDDNSARVILNNSGLTVSAVCYFNERGEITRMETMDRYYYNEKRNVKYTTRYDNYQPVDGGIKVPIAGVAEWNFEDRDFAYFDGRIVDIQFNRFEKY